MSLLCSFPPPPDEIPESAICFQRQPHCSGIVWALVHLAFTLRPCKPPVQPRRPNRFIPQGSVVASSHTFPVFCFVLLGEEVVLVFVCANLSMVSTSKQKRLSMDSVFLRMQDFRVSIVGACGERRNDGQKKREDANSSTSSLGFSKWT